MTDQPQQPVLTVLIVDDEDPLREELRDYPWERFGAELAGEARSGDEALRMCAGLQPDVVITDITMPVMDGLELCRQLRSRYPLVQIVLLTCHSEFEYAREALKLGALDYLIKVSLDEEDMAAVLEKARRALRREHAGRRGERYERRSELSRLLLQLIRKGEVPPALPAMLAAGIAGEAPSPGGQAGPAASEAREQSAYRSGVKAADSQERPGPEPGPGGAAPGAAEPGPVLSAVRLHASFKPEYRYEATVALQRSLDERQRLARERFDWTPLGEADYMLWFKPECGDGREEERLTRSAEELMIALQRGLDRELPYLSGEIKLFALLGGRVANNGDLESAINRTEPDPSIAYFHNSGEVLAGQPAPAAAESGESRGRERRKYRREVLQAMELMARKLAEPITLTSIAGEVGISSFYLSRLFREETGEAFNDYLTRLRIDQAIRLLQTTSLKVYEVAERVGIPSYRYFSVVFRGRTGVSPTEFKKG